ncbi:MAG TPA: phosphate signaling complex protein PhoU [Clostridiales bacterium]|nr:phosphate signaling complex protein PhoU [Clostridiales bacterium]
MRTRFERQLEMLNAELIKMGALCEEAIALSIRALLENDESLLPKVFSIDSEIDQKERDIESLCIKLLLRQQPVARDLRLIFSALKMISDMERIGDQASDIAEISKYVGSNDTMSRIHIRDMAIATGKMVTESVESFVKKNLELAKSVMAYDDVVDDLFDQVKTELIQILSKDSSSGEMCLDLLMIAKYFERIGDHAVNIAEWVEYSLTGQRTDNEGEQGQPEVGG